MATILMIEDDGNFVRMVEKILRSAAHKVIASDTALGGMHRAGSEKIDLVLLDLELPDLDGKVVATMLRSRPGMVNVPIIAVSARSDAATQRLTLAFGCNGFIPKPIDTRTFPDQIAAYLAGG